MTNMSYDDSEDEDGEKDVITLQQSEEESTLEPLELEHWRQPPREPAPPWLGVKVLGEDHDSDQVISKTQPGTTLDQMPNEAQYGQRGPSCGRPAFDLNFAIFAIILKIQS